MYSWIWWIPAGIISLTIGGFGVTALALSFWDDIQQRRERKLRMVGVRQEN